MTVCSFALTLAAALVLLRQESPPLAPGAQSIKDAAPPRSTPQDRYQHELLPLELPPSLGPLPAGFDQIVQQFGRFRRAQAGDSVELLSLQQGLSVAQLCVLNRVEPGHVFEEGRLVCLDRTHRRAPDESLEYLAELYETDVATLRSLNGLQEGALPPAWRKLTVPPVLQDLQLPGDEVARAMKVYFPSDDAQELDQWLEMESFELQQHRVCEGDTWDSIAAEYGSSAKRLLFARLIRSQYRQDGAAALPPLPEPGSELQIGELLAVDSSVRVRPGRSPIDLALVFDFLSADLDELLALNGLEAPEQLAKQKRVRVPLSYFSLRFATPKEDGETSKEEPGEAVGDYRRIERAFTPEMKGFLARLDAERLRTMILGMSLARVEAGEELSDLAARCGVDADLLLQLNPDMDAQQLAVGDVVCLSAGHRCLPGETLEMIAALHRTKSATLRRINRLPPQEEPAPWSWVLVPGALFWSGGEWYTRMVVHTSVGESRASLDLTATRRVSYRWREGDSLEQLVVAGGPSVEQLRRMNDLAADRTPSVGELILLENAIDIGVRGTPVGVVSVLEQVLRVPMEEALALSGLESPDEFTPGTALRLPARVSPGVESTPPDR